MERDHTRVRHAIRDLPLDALVFLLLDDLGAELLRDAPDLGLERDVGVVLLGHVLEAVHELRPLFELRPLLVDGAERDTDVDVLLDRHPPALADTGLPRLAALAAAREHALAGLLRHARGATGLVDLVADRVLDLAADLVAGLLDRTAAVAPDAAHKLPGTLGRQRHERRYTDTRRQAL